MKLTNTDPYIIPDNYVDEDEIDPTVDYSKYNYPRDIWHMLPTWEVAIKVGTFVPVIIFGIVGNSVLLYIIYKNRGLRTPTNLLIANMALADLLTITISPLMFMFHDFYQKYVLGHVGCKMEGFVEGTLMVTAVLNLCAVSYDRLTAIVLPSETRLTLLGAKLVMIFTWIFGFLIASPLSLFRTYRERQWKNFLETYCTENQQILPIYWHVLIAALVWFPLCVMVLCYSAIFWKLDRYEQQVLKREHPISVSYKRKVAKTLFIVLITFIILRLPFTTLVFIRNEVLLRTGAGTQLTASFVTLWYTSHYLMFFNAAINPLIYGLTNDNFRRAYHQTPGLGWLCQTREKTNKPPTSRNRLFNGRLQPRGPIGNDKITATWMVFSNKKNVAGATSMMSRTTRVSTIKSIYTNTSEFHSEVYVGTSSPEKQDQTMTGAKSCRRKSQLISNMIETTGNVKRTETVVASNGFI